MRVVFVHGALVRDGAWWWHRVAGLLAVRGVRSSTPLLPSCGETGLTPGIGGPGFVDDVVSVREHLQLIDEPTVIVAHSYAGMVVSEAAEALDHVEQLLFIASFLPLPEESLASLGGDGPTPPWISLDLGTGTFALLPEFAAGTYLQDCPDEVVAPAIDRLVRQSLAVTQAPVTAAAWQGIPSTYVVCADDLGTPPELQRQQAERAGRVVELPSGHHPFLSMPQAVADLVLAL
jgi:pimeloyl-ACP methyl ester carboxylesterase